MAESVIKADIWDVQTKSFDIYFGNTNLLIGNEVLNRSGYIPMGIVGFSVSNSETHTPSTGSSFINTKELQVANNRIYYAFSTTDKANITSYYTVDAKILWRHV